MARSRIRSRSRKIKRRSRVRSRSRVRRSRRRTRKSRVNRSRRTRNSRVRRRRRRTSRIYKGGDGVASLPMPSSVPPPDSKNPCPVLSPAAAAAEEEDTREKVIAALRNMLEKKIREGTKRKEKGGGGWRDFQSGVTLSDADKEQLDENEREENARLLKGAFLAAGVAGCALAWTWTAISANPNVVDILNNLRLYQ